MEVWKSHSLPLKHLEIKKQYFNSNVWTTSETFRIWTQVNIKPRNQIQTNEWIMFKQYKPIQIEKKTKHYSNVQLEQQHSLHPTSWGWWIFSFKFYSFEALLWMKMKFGTSQHSPEHHRNYVYDLATDWRWPAGAALFTCPAISIENNHK